MAMLHLWGGALLHAWVRLLMCLVPFLMLLMMHQLILQLWRLKDLDVN